MRASAIEFHSLLSEPMQGFISYKRALNRRFRTEERALHLLDRYLIEENIADTAALTPELIDAFLASRPRARPRSHNHLLGVIRRLFDWMVDQGHLAQSPVRAKPRRSTHQHIPYLFDLTLARRLIERAAALKDKSRGVLRGPTYATVFALLFGLGLRVGEVARLARGDVDLGRGLLFIRQTKFAKDRLVPIGPRMAARLADFIELRERQIGPLGPDAALFSFSSGHAIHPGTISQTFHALVPHLGLEYRPGVCPPRLHDLRHSFAVATLLRWYRSGCNPAARLLHLSTYLGHVNPSSTAVYLTITGELLDEAAGRFGRYAEPLSIKGAQ
jgi:integrase